MQKLSLWELESTTNSECIYIRGPETDDFTVERTSFSHGSVRQSSSNSVQQNEVTSEYYYCTIELVVHATDNHNKIGEASQK